MTKIIVTGGAGFIGSHVAERLLQSGFDVSIIDDLNDFYPPAYKRANLAEVAKFGSALFFEANICDYDRVFDILERTRPEAVIHLAARAGVRPSLQQPLLYEKVNVQ